MERQEGIELSGRAGATQRRSVARGMFVCRFWSFVSVRMIGPCLHVSESVDITAALFCRAPTRVKKGPFSLCARARSLSLLPHLSVGRPHASSVGIAACKLVDYWRQQAELAQVRGKADSLRPGSVESERREDGDGKELSKLRKVISTMSAHKPGLRASP